MKIRGLPPAALKFLDRSSSAETATARAESHEAASRSSPETLCSDPTTDRSGHRHGGESPWGMDIRIVSKYPPWELASGISFADSHATLQIDRAWMAEVIIAHSDRVKLEALDWRSLLTAKNTALFKIDQKVGPDEYKNVVLYQQLSTCGNDITGEKTRLWDESVPEQLAKFASCLMSLD
ncbi:hypothetical protein B0T11DRAFT_301449 [Plectosphaerella cucumerina]|uniref:Uncharacterized protein n=1 Tax=Plectosphaerella cucumerina TaxID=40658 RepID=A0A8K0T9Q8_9PEZI|nr:hypothetical protein B0T11DRAFT_301449 [Plectosphaerella cucumerina]